MRVEIVTPPTAAAVEFLTQTLVPLLIMALFLNPRLRWALAARLDRIAYAWRLAGWRERWRRLPGWRQEMWNHDRLPPEELRAPEPGWVKL